MKNKRMSFVLTTKNAWLLWLSQCLNIAAIAVELDSWMLAIIALSLVWQALHLHKKTAGNNTDNIRGNAGVVPRVSPIILGLFAIFGCLVIVVTAKGSGLLISMVHLLCFSYTLKAFELKARSDFYQLILLGLFVLSSALIFKQDLAFSAIIFSLLLLNLTVLIQAFSFEQSVFTNVKVIGLIIIQSTILAVALFLIFPRLSPFWQMPIAKSAQIGLSDNVKPGDIAKLTRSSKLAFRVDFKAQEVPSYEQLYWRAMVLEDYDGKQWTRHDDHLTNQNSQTEIGNEILVDTNQIKTSGLSYQVIIEPSYQKFMFALAPAIVPADQRDIIAMPDYTFLSTTMISQAKSYQLTSYLNAPLALEINSHSNNINLRYPEGSNPRLEKLASKLKQDFIDPQALAQAVLTRIFEEDFSYTLEPPPLKNNSLDQFFFDTQAGFCVHYASAFTYLMRASGIPARVVTGYLGGEYNDATSSKQNNTKGHMSVYQYDAHAWSEIWVQGKGWLRIDPTGAVDPQRVNSGWSNQLLQQQSKLSNDFFTLYQLKNNAWLNMLRLRFDALDYQWSRWVINFTDKQQYDLLQKWFGNMKPWKLAIVIAAVLIISMLSLMLILHFLYRDKGKRIPQQKWQAIYLSALSKLAKLGLTKPKEMTVNDFAKAVRNKTPELAISFTRLSNTYNTLSYQVLNDDERQRLTAMMVHQYRQFVATINNDK